MKYRSMIENNPDFDHKIEGLEVVSITFHDGSSHLGLLTQVVEKLAAHGFASEKEIKQEWSTLLQVELEKGKTK